MSRSTIYKSIIEGYNLWWMDESDMYIYILLIKRISMQSGGDGWMDIYSYSSLNGVGSIIGFPCNEEGRVGLDIVIRRG